MQKKATERRRCAHPSGQAACRCTWRWWCSRPRGRLLSPPATWGMSVCHQKHFIYWSVFLTDIKPNISFTGQYSRQPSHQTFHLLVSIPHSHQAKHFIYWSVFLTAIKPNISFTGQYSSQPSSQTYSFIHSPPPLNPCPHTPISK